MSHRAQKTRVFVGATAMALAITVAPAAAKAPPPASSPGAEDLIERLDRDGDGMLAPEEIRAARVRLFALVDRTGDGAWSDADLPIALARARIPAAVQAVQARFDADGDGQISEREFIDGPIPVLERGDLNGDGRLDAAELRAAEQRLRAMFGIRTGSPG